MSHKEYFTSDIHNGEKSYLSYCHRPFVTLDEQRKALITIWNRIVEPGDDVWILGDIGKPDILHALNGNLHIVLGNHDDYDEICSEAGANVKDICRWPIIYNDLILSHEPVTDLPVGSRYINVHGHLHGHDYGVGRWIDGNRYVNVCMDRNNFMPITLIEIRERLEWFQLEKDSKARPKGVSKVKWTDARGNEHERIQIVLHNMRPEDFIYQYRG